MQDRAARGPVIFLVLLAFQLISTVTGLRSCAGMRARVLPGFIFRLHNNQNGEFSAILTLPYRRWGPSLRSCINVPYQRGSTASTVSTPGTTQPAPRPKSLQDLREIASFFPGTPKDNSTAFFHASCEFATVPEAVATALHMSHDRAAKLHEIGAVYIYRQNKFRRTHLIEKYPPSTVLEGDLFRVYLFPRRFPECMIDYTFRVIWENDDLLLVDKPPGCPCSLHVSNALEALDVAASASLGLNLIRMNRLDVVTSGLVPLAKTAQGATRFWEEIRRDRLGKRYKALLTGPVPVGLLEHYMPGKIIHRRPAPRAISRRPLPGWKLCQTRVLSCQPVAFSELNLVAIHDGQDGGSGGEKDLPPSLYEVEAELVTGRTHQLRAVFAAEGSPIWQDSMYAPMTSFLLEDEKDPAIQALYPLCMEPRASTGIALQCARLTFWEQTVHAGAPWWRRKGVNREGGCPDVESDRQGLRESKEVK